MHTNNPTSPKPNDLKTVEIDAENSNLSEVLPTMDQAGTSRANKNKFSPLEHIPIDEDPPGEPGEAPNI